MRAYNSGDNAAIACKDTKKISTFVRFEIDFDMAKENELSIELKAEVAKGTYSNLAIITHSHSEFIIDFATMLPGLAKPEVTNRILMTPEHAKRLYMALQDNISTYESQFGAISLGGEPKATFPMGGIGGNGTKS